MEPLEIIAAPYKVWVAATDASFPAVDEDPDAAWTRLGSSGDGNYGDDGVTVQHNQEIEKWRGQSVQPVKAFRTSEDLVVAFTLHDLSAEQYALILNDADVTQTAAGTGQAGTDEFPLARGGLVAVHKVLVRGLSPAGEDFVAQYEVPRAYEGNSQEVQHQKGTPAGLACEWHALADLDATDDRDRFGTLRIQTAAAT